MGRELLAWWEKRRTEHARGLRDGFVNLLGGCWHKSRQSGRLRRGMISHGRRRRDGRRRTGRAVFGCRRGE